MEEIAAEMGQDGAREWPWRRVLTWLGARLAQDEVLRTRYAKNGPELLEEDFRTATFVLRPDDSPESFRFAHTSLQEYFLARYLLQALVDNEAVKWEMPFPSPETLDFLGQLLATSSAGSGRGPCAPSRTCWEHIGHGDRHSTALLAGRHRS